MEGTVHCASAIALSSSFGLLFAHGMGELWIGLGICWMSEGFLRQLPQQAATRDTALAETSLDVPGLQAGLFIGWMARSTRWDCFGLAMDFTPTTAERSHTRRSVHNHRS